MSEPCPSRRLCPGRGGAALLAVVAAAVAVVPALARGAAPAAGSAGQPGAGSGPAAPTSSPATTAAVYRAAPAVSPARVNGALAATGAPRGQRTRFRVGFAKELLDPSAADIAGGQLHLGGYGIFPTRATTGPLVDGDGSVEHLYVRAVAISNDAGKTLLLAALENQGTFTAYKQGAFGIWDVRQQVSHDTGVPAAMIVVNSDHSHAGPDLIGLWGGVPVDYLKYVHDQAVKALDEAYAKRVPATLAVGANIPTMPTPAQGGYAAGTATPGEDFVHSQFGQDSLTGYHDETVDTQLRVLQAYDQRGAPLGTLINYAAHATVMGGGNVRYSADWPGRVAAATELAVREPVAVTMVADVGRSQPPRPTTYTGANRPAGLTGDVDALDTWTRLFTPWVLDALSHAAPLSGHNDTISGTEVFTREPATNAALLGVSYSGELPVRGYGAYRASTAPWVTGNAIGTFVSAHRVGDILFTAAPGEAYPDIRAGVSKELSGMRAVFTFGLANDQLGYLIAPTTEYGWITVSNPGNDNAFFNVTPAYGDHVMCTQTAAAAGLGFALTGAGAAYGANAADPPCPLLAASDAIPMGPAPQQPWPFADGVALPPPPQ